MAQPRSHAESVECLDRLRDRHGQQGRIGLGGEGISSAQLLMSECDMRPFRRSPVADAGRSEEDHRGATEGIRQMRRPRVGADDEVRSGDARAELSEGLRARRHTQTSVRIDRRPGRNERGDPLGSAAFGPRAGEHDLVSALEQLDTDRGETLDRPQSASLRSSDVDDRSGGRQLARKSGRIDPQILGIGANPQIREHPRPAATFMQVLNPFRAGPAGCRMTPLQRRRESLEPRMARRAAAVEVDDTVHGSSEHANSSLRWSADVIRAHRQDRVHTSDRGDQRAQVLGTGEDEVGGRKRRPQSSQSRNSDEQVADSERAQRHHDVSAHGLRLPSAILFDRDDTLIRDVPYNGDPDRVVPVDTAASAVALARSCRVPVGVISNQSGIGRGLVSAAEVEAVNRRVDGLLGPFDVWRRCPHVPDDGCRCRKPAPGMLLSAIDELDVPIAEAVMIGDIGADVLAARAAGCRGILVPTQRTLPEEVSGAEAVAETLLEAVVMALRGSMTSERGAACAGLGDGAAPATTGGSSW